MDINGPFEWNTAVFCQNEAARIGPCLRSIRAAAGDHRILVTLIANGTTDDSVAVAATAARDCGLPLAIYRIEAGDKSNAINRFYYELRVSAAAYFFVDGYVTINPEALEGLAACLATHPHANAATGVCINGRTMRLATQETLEHGGRLHGQLHALRPDFIDRMVARGIRIPLGIYWGDGLLGSMAAHDLDAMTKTWDNTRIVGVADARYEIPTLSVFRYQDLKRQLKRKVRQMRGRLQNQAIKEVIYRAGYEGLPGDADAMVRDYLAPRGTPAMGLLDRPFMARAVREINRAIGPDPALLQPTLVSAG